MERPPSDNGSLLEMIEYIKKQDIKCPALSNALVLVLIEFSDLKCFCCPLIVSKVNNVNTRL